MEKISVIIPVYNIEKHIEKCLLSVMGQSYKELNIIIVNDGSTDETLTICQKLAFIDSRIKIVNISHGGVAKARNEGLKHIDSKLLFWVDGDDFLMPQTIELLYRMMTLYDAEIVKSELSYTDDLKKWTRIYEKDAYMKKVLTDEIKSYLAGTLFKASLFEQIQFPEGYMVEDYAIYPKLIEKSKTIVSIKDQLYIYQKDRIGSETNIGRNSILGLYSRTRFTLGRFEAYRKKYPRECEILFSQFVAYANITYMKSTKENKYKCIREEIHSGLEKYNTLILKNRHLSYYKKVIAQLIINKSFLIYPFCLLHEIKGKLNIYKGRY